MFAQINCSSYLPVVVCLIVCLDFKIESLIFSIPYWLDLIWIVTKNIWIKINFVWVVSEDCWCEGECWIDSKVTTAISGDIEVDNEFIAASILIVNTGGVDEARISAIWFFWNHNVVASQVGNILSSKCNW